MRRLEGLCFVLFVAPAAWSEEVQVEEESLKKKGVAAESAGWTRT